MITLQNGYVILTLEEFNSNINFVTYNPNTKFSNRNPALKIEFSNDKKFNISCIKKLVYFEQNNIEFCTEYDDLKVKYIVSNYNNDILYALQAISITDKKEKITYLYDKIFNSLDDIWNQKSPCDFCNNVCISYRNRKKQREDGCCYSFTYSKKPFEIENFQKCQYLGENKRCITQNISCKLFVCNYLKKNKKLNIKMKDFLLIQSFFTSKQKLILKYNYFRNKNEIISKLLENDTHSLWTYYWKDLYRI